MNWEKIGESLINKSVYLLALGIEGAVLYRFYWFVEPEFYSLADYYL
jgi:hypothetical protein